LIYRKNTMNYAKKKALATTFSTAFILHRVGKKQSENLFKAHKRGGVEAIAGLSALHRALYQASVQQFFQVLRHGALRQWQHLHDFATYAALPIGQLLQDGDAGRVGERLRQGCQLLFLDAEFFFFVNCHFRGL
jgi:predicted RNA-binding Zn ribbon-like protein